jgi:outer membrane protein assembly factor BamD (BamD/ComL family)
LTLTLARGDAATDLNNAGVTAFQSKDFKTAAQDFDQVVANYPTAGIIHDARIRAGLAHLNLGEFQQSIDAFSKETVPHGGSQGTALFYTGVAYLQMASKAASPPERTSGFAKAVSTFTQLLDTIHSARTAENSDYTEDALYYRALAYFNENKYAEAEADVKDVLQSFPTSLSRPDYQLLLGNLYAQEASRAVNDKKPDDDIRQLVDEAVQAFDAAAADPNALVQANDARLAKAQVLFLEAALDATNPAGYEKSLEAYREVRRKDDLVPLQMQRIQDLITKNQQTAQNNIGTAAGVVTENARLIQREQGRLQDLKDGPDPIIEALIGIAQCYNAMKEGDEARTVLHRLAKATLTPDEQHSVDFAIIYSYVLANQPDKANKALADYQAKHPGDKQIEGLRVGMAADLIKRKDFQDALMQVQQSLQDFPQGEDVPQAITLEAEAYRGMGQFDKAKSVGEDYLEKNPNSPMAMSLILNQAETEMQQGNFNDALADFGKVKDATTATPEIQVAATAGYIQTLQSLKRDDDVIKESQAFAAKFPNDPALPNVLVMGAIAMDHKGDPGAVAALQAVAKQYPDNTAAASFALFYIVNIYQRADNGPALEQAAADLAKAFPTQYAYLAPAADAVSAVYVKQKKYDQAIAQYQPLADATQPDVAAAALVKIGKLWLQSVKGLDSDRTLTEEAKRGEAQKRFASAQEQFVTVLKNYPGQLGPVNDAFQGLDAELMQQRSWGLLKDADFADALTKATADLTDPPMQARVALAKAGLAFIEKGGSKMKDAALASFRATVAANPNLTLTRTEADRYGELLIAAKDYPTAQQVYTNLLASNATDPYTQADGDYGLGAVALAQGDVATAKTWFEKMKALPGGAAWHPHIADANYGLALAGEQSGQPDEVAAAKQTYSGLMQAPNTELQAKAMLGYGRILAQSGQTTKPARPGDTEYANYYFQQVDTIFGPAVPELSAEGLYDAGQNFAKAGDTANAQKMYQAILKNYATTAPDWAAKAQAAMAGQ